MMVRLLKEVQAKQQNTGGDGKDRAMLSEDITIGMAADGGVIGGHHQYRLRCNTATMSWTLSSIRM
jgi:hypothetical protein